MQFQGSLGPIDLVLAPRGLSWKIIAIDIDMKAVLGRM